MTDHQTQQREAQRLALLAQTDAMTAERAAFNALRHANECRRDEVARLERQINLLMGKIVAQASELGALRALSQPPKCSPDCRRTRITIDGTDLTVDHDTDEFGDVSEWTVWAGSEDITWMLTDSAISSITTAVEMAELREQAEQARDDADDVLTARAA